MSVVPSLLPAGLEDQLPPWAETEAQALSKITHAFVLLSSEQAMQEEAKRTLSVAVHLHYRRLVHLDALASREKAEGEEDVQEHGAEGREQE